MRKEDYLRYREYLKTKIGSFDEAMCSMAIAESTLQVPAHIVELEIAGETYLFARSQDDAWTRTSIARAIAVGMKKDRVDSYTAAGAATEPFTFAWVRGKRLFGNFHETPRSRNIVGGGNTVAGYVLTNFLEALESLRHVGRSGMLWPHEAPLDYVVLTTVITDTSRAVVENAFEKCHETLTFVNAPDDDDLPVFDGQGWPSLVGAAAGFYWVRDASGNPTPRYVHQNSAMTFPTPTQAWERRPVMRLLTQAHGGIDALTGKIVPAYGGKLNTAAADARTLVERLREAGVKPTGRIQLVYSPMPALYTPHTAVVEGEQRFGFFEVPITSYFGPGRGTVLLELGGSSDYQLCFECEDPFAGGDDLLVFSLGTSAQGSQYRTYLGRTAWNGGLAKMPIFSFESERIAYGSRLLLPSAVYSDDGVNLHHRAPEVVVACDPLAMTSMPTVEEVTVALSVANVTPPNRAYYLPGTICRRLQGQAADGMRYHPLSAFLFPGSLAFLGDCSVEFDLALLTDGGPEGVPYVAAHVPVGGDVVIGTPDSTGVLGPPVEEDESADPDAPTYAPVLMRYSSVRFSKAKTYLALDGAGLGGLSRGQGVLQPLDQKQSAALTKLASEIAGQDFAVVVYSSPYTVPRNITDRLIVARDYRKARDKACLSDDFEKQEYVRGITWGQVKQTMNDTPSMTAFYSLSNISEMTLDLFGGTSPKRVAFRPGTSPAILDVEMTDGTKVVADIDNQDPAWAALAQGTPLSGITLPVLSTSWGYIDPVTTSDVGETSQALKAINSATDTVRQQMGASPYGFSPGALVAAGFPDVEYMVPDDAYKVMIASKIIFDRVGGSLTSFVLQRPSKALESYAAQSMVRQAKWEQRYVVQTEQP